MKNISTIKFIAGSFFLPLLLGATIPKAPALAQADGLNWDWTKDERWLVYFSSIALPPPSVASADTVNPFFKAGHDLNMNPKDMYPEDGWTYIPHFADMISRELPVIS